MCSLVSRRNRPWGFGTGHSQTREPTILFNPLSLYFTTCFSANHLIYLFPHFCFLTCTSEAKSHPSPKCFQWYPITCPLPPSVCKVQWGTSPINSPGRSQVESLFLWLGYWSITSPIVALCSSVSVNMFTCVVLLLLWKWHFEQFLHYFTCTKW